MLGLGVGSTKAQGYYPGENGRERFLKQLGTYHATNNPVGAHGSGYIGDFTAADDKADFSTTNATLSIYGSDHLRVAASASAGRGEITMRVTPGIKLNIVYVISAVNSTNARLLIGTSSGASDLYNSGNITAGTVTTTFTPTAKIMYVHFVTMTSGRWVNWGSFSVKKA